MSKRFPWTVLAAVLFAILATERTLRALAIAPGPELPVLLFACVAGEAAGAVLAALGLYLRSRVAYFGLALFAVCAAVHMAGDVAVYGVRSLIDGLAGSFLALALAAFGWIVLERARGLQARNTTGQSSESRTSPSRT